MHQFSIYDLATFDWKKGFDDQGIDSLESIALITSVEHEFHVVFEDNVFENIENLTDLKKEILCDHNAF
jgi:NADH dehydrogenase (ubiquinone) 1 alpha/beta subcomplex 1